MHLSENYFCLLPNFTPSFLHLGLLSTVLKYILSSSTNGAQSVPPFSSSGTHSWHRGVAVTFSYNQGFKTLPSWLPMTYLRRIPVLWLVVYCLRVQHHLSTISYFCSRGPGKAETGRSPCRFSVNYRMRRYLVKNSPGVEETNHSFKYLLVFQIAWV